MDDQNDLNVLSNVGDGIRCQIFDDSDCSYSTTVEAELLGTNSGLIGTVLGHAVARSSWGKSGCEQKCCFQINGGLHRSSGEAPLDTEFLQIPIWCHVNKFKSPSSTQTRVEVVDYLNKWNEFSVHSIKNHRTKHKKYLNADQKKTKQDENIKGVSVWKDALSKSLTLEYITNNVVICDGAVYIYCQGQFIHQQKHSRAPDFKFRFMGHRYEKSFNRTAFNFGKSVMSSFHLSTTE
jgi:hypothetical protein